MRKFIFSLIYVLVASTNYAKEYSNKLEGTPIDVKPSENVTQQTDSAVIYRLFPTQNMWNFIKLNTRNGQMWQVQYNPDESKRFETYLNLVRLVTRENEANGRFALYPTQNIYTFILIDQLDGRTWQVQWSLEAKNRLIIPIE